MAHRERLGEPQGEIYLRTDKPAVAQLLLGAEILTLVVEARNLRASPTAIR